MIPDLGKYATAVLGSYAASIVLILALVALSVVQGRRIKRQLAEVETRQEKSDV